MKWGLLETVKLFNRLSRYNVWAIPGPTEAFSYACGQYGLSVSMKGIIQRHVRIRPYPGEARGKSNDQLLKSAHVMGPASPIVRKIILIIQVCCIVIVKWK